MKNLSIFRLNGVNYLMPFMLITCCFMLWGFANDITNPMVKAFSKIFRVSVTQGTLVQVAFYGGYFVMALPAALFIRRYSYKAGVVMGLGLYALGSMLFLPAKFTGAYFPFLIAYFIMTCGLSFLETSCNPYVLSMGPRDTATLRLNLAQAFNPIGSLAGMYVAMEFIQNRLNPLNTVQRAQLSPIEQEAVKAHDLSVLINPYIAISIIILLMMLAIWLARMPRTGETQDGNMDLRQSVRRLFDIKHYREGLIAQFFYVGAQIMCWTFIIQYGTRVFMEQGMTETAAEVTSQKYNIMAMAIFCVSRFACTLLLRYIKAPQLLSALACCAIILTCGVITLQGVKGIYCLVGISACMSLMFPTIYGMSLTGLGEDAKLGAAGLIMSILGGSVLPPLQAEIIDMKTVLGAPAVNVSFVVPLVCFIVVLTYGLRYRAYERG